jgi:hypothetical protein
MRVYKSTIICCFLCLFSWGVASGVKYVARTIGIYSGACETLTGIPGVLQAAGFVPKGDCQFRDGDGDKDKNDKDKDECPPHACTVDGKKGKCKFIPGDNNHKAMCFCKVKNVSRDGDHEGDDEH